MSRNKLNIAQMGALAALLAAAACGKAISDTGGESHFQCSGDDDCSGSHQVCVRARPSDETGECKSRSELTGTGGTSGAGGTSTGGTSTGGTWTGGIAGPGSGGASTSGAPIVVGECSSACCPADEACYGTAAGAGSGRECLALRDNTGQDRIQLRQTSVKALEPVGFTIPIIHQARNSYIRLPLSGQDGTAPCFGGNAGGGGRFVQLIDIQPTQSSLSGTTSGYSRPLRSATVGAELDQGLCMAKGDFAGLDGYRMDASAMSDSTSYPGSLPAPRPLADSAWDIEPVAYDRVQTDFSLARDRTSLLDSHQAGVFFYDAGNGRYHSYARVTDMVQYGPEPTSAPVIIPVRELETRIYFNDPAHPNCAGGLVAADDTDHCYDGTEWAGKVDCNDGSCTPSEASATQEGYMLITELDQVFEPTLQLTLCVTVMTKPEAEAQGFLSDDGRSCKGSRWDPQAPNNEGLPPGNWCAATNSPATATCHDAFKFREQATFAATKIKVDSETARAATCSLSGP